MNDYFRKCEGVDNFDAFIREMEEELYKHQKEKVPRNEWRRPMLKPINIQPCSQKHPFKIKPYQGLHFGCNLRIFYAFFPWFFKYDVVWKHKWIP